MSFQDVGKPRTGQRPSQSSPSQNRSSSRGGGGSNAFAQLSDGITQYQRNLGILEKIARHIGTSAEGPEMLTQYDVQVDVLKQLGSKLQIKLAEQETSLESMERTEASKKRSTLIKLSRDFTKIQGLFKNICLDTSRRVKNKQASSTSTSTAAQNGYTTEEEQRLGLELQLQQERLNEEIMREREDEIQNIHRGMHQVNEIYKDLAHIVENQQEQIDSIEGQMEQSRANAEQGLGHISKANEKANAANCTIS